jgi:hypothetical protein
MPKKGSIKPSYDVTTRPINPETLPKINDLINKFMGTNNVSQIEDLSGKLISNKAKSENISYHKSNAPKSKPQNYVSLFRQNSSYTRINNSILDNIFPLLSCSEQVVYLQLFRLATSSNQDVCLVNQSKLSRLCNLTDRSIRTVLYSLTTKGLIQKVGYSLGGQAERGIVFRLMFPSWFLNELKSHDTSLS